MLAGAHLFAGIRNHPSRAVAFERHSNGRKSQSWHFPLQVQLVGHSAVPLLLVYNSPLLNSISTRHLYDGVSSPTASRLATSPSRDAAICSRNGKRSHNWHLPLQVSIVGLSAVLDCYRSTTRFCVAISTRPLHDGLGSSPATDPLRPRTEMRPFAAERQEVPQLTLSSASANCGTCCRS